MYTDFSHFIASTSIKNNFYLLYIAKNQKKKYTQKEFLDDFSELI